MGGVGGGEGIGGGLRGEGGEKVTATGPLLRVLFLNRSASSSSAGAATTRDSHRDPARENIHNTAALLARCASALSGRVACDAWEFGRRGLAADVARMRETDVLIGTHGAGLTNGFFMREGSALVEVQKKPPKIMFSIPS